MDLKPHQTRKGWDGGRGRGVVGRIIALERITLVFCLQRGWSKHDSICGGGEMEKDLRLLLQWHGGGFAFWHPGWSIWTENNEVNQSHPSLHPSMHPSFSFYLVLGPLASSTAGFFWAIPIHCHTPQLLLGNHWGGAVQINASIHTLTFLQTLSWHQAALFLPDLLFCFLFWSFLSLHSCRKWWDEVDLCLFLYIQANSVQWMNSMNWFKSRLKKVWQLFLKS